LMLDGDSGTQSISYVDVKDNSAAGGQTIVCYTGTEGCINSGNNTNWNFISSTSIAFVSSLNPSTFGSGVTLTATVTPASATGTLTFKNGGSIIGSAMISHGSGAITINILATGSHALTAEYGGSSHFYGSVSSTLTQTVNKANSAMVMISSLNPSTFGSGITLTTTVTPSTATGTLTFKDGSITIGSATIGHGSGSMTTSILAAGSHDLTTIYVGNANHNGSISTTVTQMVHKAVPTIDLVSTPNPSTYGSGVLLAATILPASATGTVTFKEGAVTLGSSAIGQGSGSITVSSLSYGNHDLTVEYGGNGNYTAAVSPANIQNVNTKAASTVSVASSLHPSLYGSGVILTATVVPSIAGSVTFFDGTTDIATVAVGRGSGSVTISDFGGGNHHITATFSGNADYNGSTSSVLIQTVTRADSFTVLLSSVNPTVHFQNTLLMATVTPSAATGSVTFKNGTATIGTGALAGGFATLDIASLALGTHSLTAVYNGNNNYRDSASDVLPQRVLYVTGTGTILGTVWNDENGNGIKEGGELSGLNAVTINLSGNTATGALLRLARNTDLGGIYGFTSILLSDGSGYTVSVSGATIPAGYLRTTATSSGILLGTGAMITQNFGFVHESTLSGSVFVDANGNGAKDAEDTQVFSGSLLHLTGTSATGGVMDVTTRSTASGTYLFAGLPVSQGHLFLVATPPEGYISTTTNSRSVDILLGGSALHADFGYALPLPVTPSSSTTPADDALVQASENRRKLEVTVIPITVEPHPVAEDRRQEPEPIAETSPVSAPAVVRSGDITTIASQGRNVCEVLACLLPEGWNATIPLGTVIAEEVQSFFADRVAQVRSRIAALGGAAQHQFALWMESGQQGWEIATNIFQEAGRLVAQSLAENAGSVGDGFDQMVQIAGQGLRATGDLAWNLTRDSLASAERGIAFLEMTLDRSGTLLAGAFAEQDFALRSGMDQTMQIAGEGGHLVAGFADASLKMMASGMDILDQDLQMMALQLRQSGGDFGVLVARGFDAAHGGLVAVRDIGRGGMTVAQEGIGTLQAFVALGVDTATQSMMVAMDATRVIGTGLGETFGTMNTVAQQGWQQLAVVSGEGVSAVIDGSTQVLVWSGDTAQYAVTVLTHNAQSAGEGIVQGIRGEADALGQGMDQQMAFVRSAIDDTSTLVISAGSQVSEVVAEGTAVASDALVRGVIVANDVAIRARSAAGTIVASFDAQSQLEQYRTKLAEPQQRYKTSLTEKNGQVTIAALHLSFIDAQGEPYAHTPVVLFSDPKVAVTDEGGIATFHNVPVGEHTLEIQTKSGKTESRLITLEPPSGIALAERTNVSVSLPVSRIIVSEVISPAAPWIGERLLVPLLVIAGIFFGAAMDAWRAAWWAERRRKSDLRDGAGWHGIGLHGAH